MGGGNKERARERAREWYKNNRARAMASMKPNTNKWRENNPEKWALSKWRSYLKHHYGMSIEQYDAMVFDQGGLCAICGGLPFPMRGKKFKLHIDHDHSTGQIRGLLCATCNTALHKLEKSDEWADKARAYLMHHREKSKCQN